MSNIANLFLGSCGIKICGSERVRAEELINFLIRTEIPYSDLKKTAEYEITAEISAAAVRRLRRLVDKRGFLVYIVYRKGLPFFLYNRRKRVGVMIGAALFCIMLWRLSFTVWEIEVSGNDRVPSLEICDRLETLGFGVGSYIPSVDFYSLCNRYLIEWKDMSWISVNINGTLATVEVRETEYRDIMDTDDSIPSNLVASCDGQIESTEVYSGNTVVKYGDTVKKGELLVSGFNDVGESLYKLTRSRGKIYAKAEKFFEIEIPYLREKNEYTGREEEQKSVYLLGMRISSGDFKEDFEEYRTDTSEKRIWLFDRIKLPITVKTEIRREYTVTEERIDSEEAAELAESELTEKIEKELKDADILEKRVEIYDDGEIYRIECSISCICDIAEEKEIIIT